VLQKLLKLPQAPGFAGGYQRAGELLSLRANADDSLGLWISLD
jgi:hypothetical protein